MIEQDEMRLCPIREARSVGAPKDLSRLVKTPRLVGEVELLETSIVSLNRQTDTLHRYVQHILPV